MVRKALVLIVATLLKSASGGAAPADPQLLIAVPSIAAMAQLADKYTYVHVVGYHAGSRKGGGNFVWARAEVSKRLRHDAKGIPPLPIGSGGKGVRAKKNYSALSCSMEKPKRQ